MSDNQPILGIETTDVLCGAAVHLTDHEYTESVIHIPRSHAEKLTMVIDAALQHSGVKLDELAYIAVSMGPGSFTGLRIGLAAAKGMALGAEIPIMPVSTFDAIALELLPYVSGGEDFAIANKVNTNEIYFAKFSKQKNMFKLVDGLTIIPAEKLDEYAQGIVIGGNIDYSGANDFIPLTAPRPLSVCKISRMMDKEKILFDYDLLEPNYLKNFIVKEKRHD